MPRTLSPHDTPLELQPESKSLEFPPAPPANELRAWASASLGSLQSATFRGWPHGESEVWEIVSARGERAFVKVFRQARKFRQERRAYLEWCPQLGGRCPQLLAVREEPPRALLLSSVPGVRVETLAPSPAAHRQAGALLRVLHELPVEDDDPLSLADGVQQRLEAWSSRAPGLVDAAGVDWVRGRVAEALPLLAGLARVPCHRDYTGRNWLWHEDALYLIDFEHARPDLAFMDLERLWRGVWREQPDLREAFLEGYGRALSQDEEALLARLAALGALSTVIWAVEHHDAPFEAEVRRWLEELRADADRT